jgi:hypothetical protein
MRLTIGMATFDDFDGLYFTIQSLRLHHGEAIKSAPCELIVVDNKPDSEQGKEVKKLLENQVRGDFAKVRYIPMTEVIGTSAPRDRIFREAEGEAVLVMDGHVMFRNGAIGQLLKFYADNPTTQNLHHGPLLYDSLESIATHFNDEWRAEMWGTWGTDARGQDPDGEPFEIPGCGLGVFTCRREAWPGFPEGLRGFGGEEMSLHEAFRQRGDVTLCLPFLRWVHRFGRPRGVPYPLYRKDKVRNYLIWARHLNLSLDRAHSHFVGEGKFGQSDWDAILSELDGNSAGATVAPAETKPGCKPCGQKAQATAAPVREMAGKIQSLVIQSKLRELAKQCDTVVQIGCRDRGATAALLAGQPKAMHVFGAHPDAAIEKRKGDTDLHVVSSLTEPTSIPPADLVLFDGPRVADAVYTGLQMASRVSRRWIVLPDSAIFGEFGEGATREAPIPGVRPALRRFTRENPTWCVYYHTQSGGGVTVLTSEKADKKTLPGAWQLLKNVAKAALEHVATGAARASDETINARLDLCAECDQRRDNRCSVCGCFVEVKSTWREQPCPLGKWPMDEEPKSFTPDEPPK